MVVKGLNCWPTKNFSTINRSWDDFPDRKFDSNFIHAAENALSYSSYLVAESTHSQVMKTCDKIQRSEVEHSPIVLKIISCMESQQLAGEFRLPLEWPLGLKISRRSVLPFRCYLNYHFASFYSFIIFSLLLPPSIEAGHHSFSFLNLADPHWSFYQVHLPSCFLLAFF